MALLAGFALYFAPLIAALLACDRMKERRRRHKIAAICAGIAVFMPAMRFLQPDHPYGFYALVSLLIATSLCLAWPPYKTDLPGGFALRVFSVFACVVYLTVYCNMGGIDMKGR